MERCPKCLEGRLEYRWFAGCLRMVCLNSACRAVFDAAREYLGVLSEIAAKTPK